MILKTNAKQRGYCFFKYSVNSSPLFKSNDMIIVLDSVPTMDFCSQNWSNSLGVSWLWSYNLYSYIYWRN